MLKCISNVGNNVNLLKNSCKRKDQIDFGLKAGFNYCCSNRDIIFIALSFLICVGFFNVKL